MEPVAITGEPEASNGSFRMKVLVLQVFEAFRRWFKCVDSIRTACLMLKICDIAILRYRDINEDQRDRSTKRKSFKSEKVKKQRQEDDVEELQQLVFVLRVCALLNNQSGGGRGGAKVRAGGQRSRGHTENWRHQKNDLNVPTEAKRKKSILRRRK